MLIILIFPIVFFFFLNFLKNKPSNLSSKTGSLKQRNVCHREKCNNRSLLILTRFVHNNFCPVLRYRRVVLMKQ